MEELIVTSREKVERLEKLEKNVHDIFHIPEAIEGKIIIYKKDGELMISSKTPSDLEHELIDYRQGKLKLTTIYLLKA